MFTPRVSVIVPCHNAARYLGEALGSIARQVPPPAEVLVIDDGSTDDSGSIAAGFASLVRCIRQANLGISAARNRGLELATGDLIAFLDADDVWTADSLSSRLAVLAGDAGADAVSGLVEQFVSPDVPDERRQALLDATGASTARVAGTLLVRRAVFDRIGGFSPAFRVGETLDWVARADAAGVRWRTLDQVVVRRRIHDDNTTARHPRPGADYLRVLKAAIDRRRDAAPSGPRSASPPG